MKDIFTRLHSLKIIIAIITISLPITLMADITPTSIINQYDNPEEIDFALNKVFEESSSTHAKALASTLRNVIVNDCKLSWTQLYQLGTLATQHKQLLEKMPYVCLATLYEFTDQIKNQIKQHQATMSFETSNNLTKACKIIQMAILKVIEKIKNISHYSINLLSATSKATDSAGITVQALLNNATCYNQLQSGLTMFINSQLATLSIEMPQNIKSIVMSEENITNLVNQALSKTLFATLTPNEIQSLKDLMQSTPITKILNNSSTIIDSIKILPIVTHWKNLAIASQSTPANKMKNHDDAIPCNA